MKNFLVFLLVLGMPVVNWGQHVLSGAVADDQGLAIPFASIALLTPADSTFRFFALSGETGYFEIRNIEAGDYLLQYGMMGFETAYQSVHIPLPEGNSIGVLVLHVVPTELEGVEVEADRIPIRLNGDTIEYNADSFKTTPDATAEDLLKKLPGVQVDQAGNIKAQGEDVQKVLVDGKEFFSSDPTVATRNLPADAVKKVQVYDGQGAESELTGIDDGTREKTINLQLKDDKKNAWFGHVMAGAGSEGHYQANAKVYRFHPKHQFAALGMMNDINEFGFSVNDYIDFSGGMGALMNSDGLDLGSEDDPVNFGQTVTGENSSGAGGLNYTFEPRKDVRYNLSYLVNAVDKHLREEQEIHSFFGDEVLNESDSTISDAFGLRHKLAFNIRHRIDSTHNVIFTANLRGSGDQVDGWFSNLVRLNEGINSLIRNSDHHAASLSGQWRASYLQNLPGTWDLFKVRADGSFDDQQDQRDYSDSQWSSGVDSLISTIRSQKDDGHSLRFSGAVSLQRKAGVNGRAEIGVRAGTDTGELSRWQTQLTDDEVGDGLSEITASRQYLSIDPSVTYKYTTDKLRLGISMIAEHGLWSSRSGADPKAYDFFLPSFWLDSRYRRGHSFSVNFDSQSTMPDIGQLIPYNDTSNPQFHIMGNPELHPGRSHQLRLGWNVFDTFSFTHFFLSASGTYQHDRVGTSRVLDEFLVQTLSYVNIADDYSIQTRGEWGTPIRPLGLTIELSASATATRSYSYQNEVRNESDVLRQNYDIRFGNRNKTKVDLDFGAGLDHSAVTNSAAGTAPFYILSWFAGGTWTPNERWLFSADMHVSQYASADFNTSSAIPLLKASLTRYLGEKGRWSLTAGVFDALERNTGLEITSDLNTLREVHSNSITRYGMFSVKYRISKFEGDSGIHVEMK